MRPKARVWLPVGAWGPCRGRGEQEKTEGEDSVESGQGTWCRGVLLGAPPEVWCLGKGRSTGPGPWSWELRVQCGACGWPGRLGSLGVAGRSRVPDAGGPAPVPAADTPSPPSQCLGGQEGHPGAVRVPHSRWGDLFSAPEGREEGLPLPRARGSWQYVLA